MKLLHFVLLASWLFSACSPISTPPAETPTSSPAVDTPFPSPVAQQQPATPTAFLPPKPTPIYPPPEFPTCEADPIPPLEFGGAAAQPPPNAEVGSAPALRPLAERRGMFVGASTAPQLLDQPGYTGLLVRHFNMITPENAMKWEVVHPEPERYDFSQGDALAAFAHANDMTLYGHTLVWDMQQPAWLIGLEAAGKTGRDEWIQILCRHIKTVVGRYRGHIYAWHVVNEPFTNEGTLRDTLWMRTIGPEHIAMAFQWAREADPEALLILNEHFAEGMNVKSQAVYALAQGLLQQGIPLDGIGLQMHVWLGGPPSQAELEENMRRLADLGLQAHITEMDVRTQYAQDSLAEKLAWQAQIYRQAFGACLQAVNCEVFGVWGLTDRHSWIPDYTGVPDLPLLFDEQGQPKPAFDTLIELLQGAP